MIQVMLSTRDNPYDPFDEFDRWLTFDIANNHNCASRVDRFCNTSSELSDEQYIKDVEQAIDEIIANDQYDIYIKIKKDIKE